MDVALYRLSVPFAILTGSIAGLLALVSWRLRRDSPFGTALQLLAVAMGVETAYHGGLLVSGSETLVLRSLLVLGYSLVPVALYAAISESKGRDWPTETFERPTVLLATVLGVLLYAIGGPVSELMYPSALHWVHGVAALAVIGGLYGPVRADLQREPWTQLLFDDPAEGRHRPEWMKPVDDAILDVLDASGLVLTPAVVAYNIDYHRDEVNRRLSRLSSEGFVERVERGKYRITSRGEQYVEGDAPDSA